MKENWLCTTKANQKAGSEGIGRKNIAEKIGNMELDDLDMENSLCNRPEYTPSGLYPGLKRPRLDYTQVLNY